MKTKIYRVFGSLDKKGFSYRVIEIDCIEKEKTFVSDVRRISKDDIMEMKTLSNESHRGLNYYTYCTDGNQQKALDAIKERIVKTINAIKIEFDQVYAFVKNEQND